MTVGLGPATADMAMTSPPASSIPHHGRHRRGTQRA